MRDPGRCICGQQLTFNAYPRVGPAPRFAYGCPDWECDGQQFIMHSNAGWTLDMIVQYAPDAARWAFMRATP